MLHTLIGSADFLGVNIYMASRCTEYNYTTHDMSFATDSDTKCTAQMNGERYAFYTSFNLFHSGIPSFIVYICYISTNFNVAKMQYTIMSTVKLPKCIMDVSSNNSHKQLYF